MSELPDGLYWRKVPKPHNGQARYELVNKEEIVLLNAGFNDGGAFEIAFEDTFTDAWILEWELVKSVFEEGKRLASADN